MDGERSLPAGVAQRVRPVKQLARSMYSQYGCTLFPCIYTAAAHRKASPALVSLLRALFTRSEVVVQRIAILEERFDRVRTPCAARERDCLTLAAHAHREVSTLMAPNGAHAHGRVIPVCMCMGNPTGIAMLMSMLVFMCVRMFMFVFMCVRMYMHMIMLVLQVRGRDRAGASGHVYVSVLRACAWSCSRTC